MTLLAKLLGWVLLWTIGVTVFWAWLLYFFGEPLIDRPWLAMLIATGQLWTLGFTLARELRR